MTKSNGSLERPRPGFDSIAIIAGMNQPFPVLLPHNRPHMMRPYHDTSHTGAVSGRALVHPVARQRQPRLMDTSPLHHIDATPRYARCFPTVGRINQPVAVMGMAMVPMMHAGLRW